MDTKVDIMYTKRTVLSFLARVFDPFGFISPFLMFPKIFFQDTWMLGLDWDDEIPRDQKNELVKWVKATQDLGELNVLSERSLELYYIC